MKELPVSALLSALDEGIVVMSAAEAIIASNESAERILGLTAAQMAGRTTHDPRWQAIREDGSPFPGDLHPVTISLRTGRPVHGVVMGVRKPSGELTWISINSRALFEEGEARPHAVVASFADITELKATEAALRQSEASFRLLFDENPLPMWVYDVEDLRFLAVNEAAVRHYGYTRSEFLAMSIADIRPPEDVPALRANVARTRPVQETTSWRHRKKDGTVIQVEVFSQPLPFNGHHARLVLARDVTDQQRLEAQLRQSQKMEAVGRLAGGVAHDFNNLLSVAGGYADLLLKDLEAGDPRRRRLELIRKSIESGSALTRQLLAFSRRQPAEVKATDLGAVAKGLEPMLARLIGEEHELVVRVLEGSPRVRVDPAQMEQVLMNLAVNARDAMPRGGKVLIEAKTVHLDASFAQTHTAAAPGYYVLLSVSDTGHGMDAETRSRIFEPFFTTKEAGKGTGLGLSTVYGIVKQSGGHIGVYSEVGHGTTFNIYFPLAAPQEEAAAAAPAPAEMTATESGTILLVEDGNALREMLHEMLDAAGYQVLQAETPASALDLAGRHEGEIELLLTDVVMPGMRGQELAERLRALRPGLKVLFMSGYPDETLSAQGLTLDEAQFIQKPFSGSTLLAKVRAARARMA